MDLGAEMGQKQFPARKGGPVALDIHIANMIAAGVFEVGALTEQEVGILALVEKFLGPGSIPRENKLLAIPVDLIAE